MIILLISNIILLPRCYRLIIGTLANANVDRRTV